MPKWWLLIALSFLPLSAAADESTPLLYSRTQVIITRNRMPVQDPPPMPWQKLPEELTNPALTFDVEVRDGMTLYNQEGWFNLSSLSEKNGMLLVFNSPGLLPVVPSKQYVPLDILMMDKEGKIVQILPNIMLTELEQEIYPQNPILAFFFLKGGSCAALSINPGDIMDYKIFKKPPVVLSTPEAAIPQAPQATPAGKPATPVPAQPAKAPDKTDRRNAAPMIMQGK